jgi:hypothetical protein
VAEDDRLFTNNPVTQARVAGSPRTTEFNKLPRFPTLPTVPGSGAPERYVNDANELVDANNEPLSLANPQNGNSPSNAAQQAVNRVTPFANTQPLDVQPFNVSNSPFATPTGIAPPGQSQPLTQQLSADSLLTTPLTQGEDASVNAQLGESGIGAVLPNPYRQQQLSPNVLYGNAAEGVTARRTISTDIVGEWEPLRLSNVQRAEAAAWRERTRAGLNIRDEMNGNLSPIDMVGANVAPQGAASIIDLYGTKPDANGRYNVSGISGLGSWLGSLIGNATNGDRPDIDVNFTGFGDFGSGWLGALINGVSNFQNSVFGIGLDVVNAGQSTLRAAANTPLDIGDFIADVERYQNEFRRDGDATSYYSRSQRGDDLGFSGFSQSANGRINPLGLWGNERESLSGVLRLAQLTGDVYIAPLERLIFGRNPDRERALEEWESRVRTSDGTRALMMALGLTLDVVTDPSDLIKVLSRLNAARRGANVVEAASNAIPELVSGTELAEAAQATQTAQRASAAIPDPWVTPPAPPNAVVPIPPPSTDNFVNVEPLASPWDDLPVNRPSYYSPSAIVNDMAASQIAVPSAVRGNPNFVVRGIDDVNADVISAAPELAAELGAVPIRNLDVTDSVVAAAVRSVGDEALNLIPNVLAPVNRQPVSVIESLASGEVKLDVPTLAATLPRNVGQPTQTRLALYNNASNDVSSLIPATRTPQRVYINAPEGLVNNPLFPVSIDNARPLIDSLADISVDVTFNRANRYLDSLAKQGYVQRVPDYSGFVVSMKNSDIAYTNVDNLVNVGRADALRTLRANSDAYVKTASDPARIYRQTRLLETLSPSVMRTPDMFRELATGYAPRLPSSPTRTQARLMDAVLTAEDRYTNAARLVQRVESEASNVNLALRNTAFSEGVVNRSGTVRKLSNGKFARTSQTSALEKSFLREMADNVYVVNVEPNSKVTKPFTYVVDALPEGAQPLVRNGRLNVTPDEIDELLPQLDDLVVDMADKGYVHLDLVNSVQVLPNGSILLSDNLSDVRRINEIFIDNVGIEELDEVRRVERALVNDELNRLRDTFDRDAYELGNAPRYDDAMFDNALARTVYEYDGAPLNRNAVNRVRYQTKYELDRAAQLANRELDTAISQREAAIRAFADDVKAASQRREAATQTQLRQRQQRVDDQLSVNKGECV